jgi:secondary thiamine-phosphate synthase enzyme
LQGVISLQREKVVKIAVDNNSSRVAVLNGTTPGGLATGTEFKVFSQTLQVETRDAPEFVDLTDAVRGVVEASGVENGQVLVFSRHTTASIVINEYEPLLLKDMEHFLERCAPKDTYYGHNDFAIRTVSMRPNECPNGHSHCQHLMLGTSETIPLIDGQPALGEFQRIFLVELDMPKPRQVVFQVTGL